MKTSVINSSNKLPKCQSHESEPQEIAKLARKILNSDKAQRMAEFFSLLGDANRLRILSVLTHQGLCVCDLANLLGMSESAVSHQLRTLRTLRLVSYEKKGRRVYYYLQDHHVLELYQSVADHLDETE